MENVEVGVGDRGGGDSRAMVELRRTTSVLRLFGKIITLPLEEYPNVDSLEKEVVNNGCDVVTAGDNNEDVVIVDHQDSALSREKRKMDASLSLLGEDPFYCHDHDKTMAGNKQKETSPVKKPDKILPCPRCNSSDTKFCYYNNYNVNQPRHFCKGCQRYWTAGGTMRNVPVGSGRRKSKNSDVGSFLPRRQPNGSTSAYVENNVGTNFNSNPTSASSPSSYLVVQQPWTFQIPTPVTSPSATTTTTMSKEPKSVEQQIERSVWIPKALRIDNPEEAARSSIWTTLGINKKEDKRWKINGGLFGSFEQKTTTDNNNDGHVNGVSNRILYANPAALARSINFQETID